MLRAHTFGRVFHVLAALRFELLSLSRFREQAELIAHMTMPLATTDDTRGCLLCSGPGLWTCVRCFICTWPAPREGQLQAYGHR